MHSVGIYSYDSNVRANDFREVWVDLAALYGPQGKRAVDISRPRVIDLEPRVPGVLKGWMRSLDGRWWGIVDFRIMWASRDPSVGFELTDQLVPAPMLAPRNYGAARRA
jgi:hypothetical protein